jgi:hypothetical protein
MGLNTRIRLLGGSGLIVLKVWDLHPFALGSRLGARSLLGSGRALLRALGGGGAGSL